MMDQALELTVVGLAIVFVALTTICLVVVVMRRLDGGWKRREEVVAEKAIERAPTIDDTTLVILSAAVATVIEGRFRIRRVRRILPFSRQGSAWSQQGRAVLQGSHAVRRR